MLYLRTPYDDSTSMNLRQAAYVMCLDVVAAAGYRCLLQVLLKDFRVGLRNQIYRLGSRIRVKKRQNKELSIGRFYWR